MSEANATSQSETPRALIENVDGERVVVVGSNSGIVNFNTGIPGQILFAAVFLLVFLALSLTIYLGWKSLYTCIGAVLLTLILFALRYEQRKTKAVARTRSELSILPSCVETGLYGGIIAGAIGGLLIALTYYFNSSYFQADGRWYAIVPQVFLDVTFAGSCFGLFISLGIYLADRPKCASPAVRLVLLLSGGIFGGIFAGVLNGAWTGWYFCVHGGEVVDGTLVVFGGVACVLGLSLGILFYDFNGSLRKGAIAFVLATFITALPAAVAYVFFAQSTFMDDHFGDGLWAYDGASRDIHIAVGGAILGTFTGAAVGFLAGTTVFIFRRLGLLERNNPPPSAGEAL
jgi:hypothetical protein